MIQLPPPPPRPWRSRLDRIRRRLPGGTPEPPTADYMFDFDYPPEVDLQMVLDAPPSREDIVCLHWINGFLNVKSIRRLWNHFHCPVVWIIHDLEAFAGGCHYAFGCDGFTRQCGACPRLGSDDPGDLSNQIWRRKKELLSEVALCFIAPTSWGEEMTRKSSLFRRRQVIRIPHPMDLKIFKPLQKSIARQALDLPIEKKIVLFGATYLDDRRKGIPELLHSLDSLRHMLYDRESFKPEDLFLLIVGHEGGELLSSIPFEGRHLGYIQDERLMALIYQSADVFVSPSLEDSGPMTISEAMLCETPAVAFHIGVAPDVIDHGHNGYLARIKDSLDLANGIYTILASPAPDQMRSLAGEAARRTHAPDRIAQQHVELYRTLAQSTL